MMITKNDSKQLLRLLDQLSDYFSSAGCNDHFMKNTPANRTLYKKMSKSTDEDEWNAYGKDYYKELCEDTSKDIGCCDFILLDYFVTELKKLF